jgi:hypothetical protein
MRGISMRLAAIRESAIARLRDVPGVQSVAVRLGGRARLRVEVEPSTDVARVKAALAGLKKDARVDIVRSDRRRALVVAE